MFNTTIVQRGVGVMLVAIIIYLLLRLFVFRPKEVEVVKRKPVDALEPFAVKLNETRILMSDAVLKDFMRYLDNYKGGRVIRERKKVILHEFSAMEKSDLKALYVDVVLPSAKVSPSMKEYFREYLVNIKVEGLEEEE